MTVAERRELVEHYLGELRAQRDVDMRDALEEVIHLVLALDDEVGALRARVFGTKANRAGDERTSNGRD